MDARERSTAPQADASSATGSALAAICRQTAKGAFPGSISMIWAVQAMGQHSVSGLLLGRWDHSFRPSLDLNCVPWAVVAQLVRAPDCGSGGRWFEPTQLYQRFQHLAAQFANIARSHLRISSAKHFLIFRPIQHEAPAAPSRVRPLRRAIRWQHRCRVRWSQNVRAAPWIARPRRFASSAPPA